MKSIEGLSLCLSVLVFLIIASIMVGLSVIRSDTFVQAQTPPQSINGQITVPLDSTDSIFNANTSISLGTKNISSTPFRITESDFSDQGILKGIGNVTWNQTFISTYLSDKLLEGKGNGTFGTPDGHSIAWVSSDIGRPVDGRWVFYGIILFNKTQSEPLSFLNNRIGIYKSVAGNETDYIWILK